MKVESIQTAAKFIGAATYDAKQETLTFKLADGKSIGVVIPSDDAEVLCRELMEHGDAVVLKYTLDVEVVK